MMHGHPSEKKHQNQSYSREFAQYVSPYAPPSNLSRQRFLDWLGITNHEANTACGHICCPHSWLVHRRHQIQPQSQTLPQSVGNFMLLPSAMDTLLRTPTRKERTCTTSIAVVDHYQAGSLDDLRASNLDRSPFRPVFTSISSAHLTYEESIDGPIIKLLNLDVIVNASYVPQIIGLTG
jgi:hypothetical protein